MYLPVSEIIAITPWVISVLIYWLSKSKRLPKEARNWLNKIGQSQIEALIVEAEQLAEMTGSERRQWVVDKISERYDIPKPLINLIVEFVYNLIRAKLGK